MTTRVLVPSSLTRETDRREATRKLGTIARAAAIFRVSEIIVFDDPNGSSPDDKRFVSTVLRYVTTPPYLRATVFDRRSELAHVGVLPPLRLPTWTGSESDDSGSLREGIITEVGADGRVRVNCGLQHPISLVSRDNIPNEGERVTVKISSRDPVRAKLLEEEPPGPRIREWSLARSLSKPDAGLRIATSRNGHPLTASALTATLSRRHDVGLTMAFGAPERGLKPICRSLGLDTAPSDGQQLPEGPLTPDPDRLFDLWLNTIPSQGSEVVRTEEAVIASLACLNLRE